MRVRNRYGAMEDIKKQAKSNGGKTKVVGPDILGGWMVKSGVEATKSLTARKSCPFLMIRLQQ